MLFYYYIDTSSMCVVNLAVTLLEIERNNMVVWYPCEQKEWLKLQDDYLVSGAHSFALLSHEHLGDEEEPMDLFIWGDFITKVPMLRSAMTINKELYWRTYE